MADTLDSLLAEQKKMHADILGKLGRDERRRFADFLEALRGRVCGTDIYDHRAPGLSFAERVIRPDGER